MSRDIQDLEPCLRQPANAFVARCLTIGLHIVITQTHRTREEQQALYEQGRTRPGKIVTKAGPDASPHVAGLAFDIAFRDAEGHITWDETWPGAWETVGQIGEGLGLKWGGRWAGFPDRPHFEWPNWKEVAKIAQVGQGA